jgi:Amt family ammonium transporter
VAAGADALQGARGTAAGWVAGLAAAPFLSPVAALVVGATAGLLMLLAGWLVESRLRLQDRGGVLTTFGLPALVGLLAVGVFADGTAGAGYNGVGLGQYLGAAGQGVTGLLPASGLGSDWPGQFIAQAAGTAVIFLLSFLVVSLLALPAALVIRAWGGRGATAADEGGEPGEEFVA